MGKLMTQVTKQDFSQNTHLRRCFRLCSFLLVLLLIYILLVAFNFQFVRRVPVEYVFGDRLEITVSSCDVVLQRGSTRSVKVQGLLTHLKVERTMASLDVVRIMNVQNFQGCDDQPKKDCKRVCEVVATIPEDTPPDVVWIQQVSNDKADHVVVNIDGVTLNNLMIRDGGGNWWDKAGPSIEVFMRNTTTNGWMYITLAKGGAMLQNTKHLSTADVRSDGSVTMRGVQHGGPILLNWRQPNNQACFVAEPNELVLPDENGAFALCDSMYYKSNFQSFYDTSKDFFLDRTEFGNALVKMPYCCGGSCPHASWCDGNLYSVFEFGSEGGAGFGNRAEILSANTVFDKLKTLGWSGMVPFCFREAKLMAPVDRSRAVEGWPELVPWAGEATAPSPPSFAACVRHSDCRTGYCDGTSTCAPHPSVTFSEVTGNWSSCDKVCGGGQQIRDRVCLGSDGLKYPTYLCPGLSSATDVQSCNTIACDLPLVPDNYTFGMDKDLRPEWLDITVLATLPTKATALQLRLGSSSGSMLDTVVAEVLSNECLNNLCTLQGQVKAPAYADRLLLMGKNNDGLGPAVSEAFTDRVGETGSFQKFTVQSEAGMVHFSVAGASAASGTWAPADRLPGIRMHLPDARRLMRTVGPRFGNPESTEHGVVVIDTVAVPGIPATRWVYATRPVFLSMDPSILTFLSAGILKPEIQNFRVAYLDLSCSTDFVSGIPENPTSEDFQRSDLRLRLASMYDQMQKSLRSDGWATNQRLRGELVLLDPAHGVKPHASKYWEFYTGANGDTLMKLRDVHALDQLQDAATGLSLACGAMASLLFTFVFFKLARKGIRARNMEKRAQNTLLRQKLGEIKDKEQNHLDQQIQAAEGNPFLQPLLLIDLLVMEPILSKLLNSLSRFSSEFLVVSHAEQFKRPAQVVPAEPEVDPSKAPAKAEMRIQVTTPDDKRPFVYMRHFRTMYSQWCIKHGYEPVQSRDEIIRFLVDQYNVRSVRETVWRVRGVRWRRKEEPYTATPLPTDDEPSTLWRFLNEHVVVTKDRRTHWLDMKNNRLPHGDVQIGMRQKYFNWCSERNLTPVAPEEMDPLSRESELMGLSAWALVNDSIYQEVEVQKILHCSLATEPKLVLDCRQLIADFLEVLVDILVLVLPALLISLNALGAQQVYAQTTVTDTPVQMMDVLGTALPYIGFDAGGRQVLFLTAFILSTQFVYIVLATIRVLLHYVVPERRIKRAYDWFFAIVLLVETVGITAWVGVTASWCILATILSPVKYLPYGAAVIVFGVVVVTLWKEMNEAATMMRKKAFSMIDEKLQSCLKTVQQEIQLQRHNSAMLSGLRKLEAKRATAKKKVDESTAAFDEFQQERTRRKVTPGDVFATLDADVSGTITIEEFKKLFTAMNSSLDPNMIEKMFAYADSDGSGLITQDEFEEAWGFLTEHLVNKVLHELGFGPTDILITIIMAALTLLCFFFFIFFAMQGWYNDTSFQSCVQSALVAGSGKVATIVRKRVPDDQEAGVGAIMGSMDGGDDGAGDGDGDGEGEGEGEGGEGEGEGGG
ncbi:unnamed protein product [Effrenium voratum]|uniref:EF-hand domain-containing protein n=1 Tax=Effrenium voratum TaxID=2562239 RepID=A0AA36N9R0_9DINO|nr:unnamed protein product [Effrenium voratum]CAJ1426515.1 unnamed protein product [Effrenium voratum]